MTSGAPRHPYTQVVFIYRTNNKENIFMGSSKMWSIFFTQVVFIYRTASFRGSFRAFIFLLLIFTGLRSEQIHGKTIHA